MLNKNLLRAAIAKAGITQGQLAERIGVSENMISSRINGSSCFNTEEIDKICDALNIVSNNEKADIFLASASQ